MILPDFVLPTRANQCWEQSGVDSLEQCWSTKHFKSYPYSVLYQYNSRGYRDQEWPDTVDQLQQAVWCVGDSFTVGIGSPREHTWTYLLQQQIQTRTINVSMDGASNDWIARKALRILSEIQPTYLILHWSYISRREMTMEDKFDQTWNTFYQSIRDPSWPDCASSDIDNLPNEILEEIIQVHGGVQREFSDESRALHFDRLSSNQDDVEHLLNCAKQVNEHQGNTHIIHSFIPQFVPRTEKNTVEFKISGSVIPELVQLDQARDGRHYDIATSRAFVQQIMQMMS